MSVAKNLVAENLAYISDDIDDEFVVMEDLYKLLKLRRSQEAVAAGQTYTTDEVKEYFAKKRRKRGQA